jgi:putative ABC transport system permease protein
MARNKTGAVLVALQIAVTLAVIVNAVFIVQQRIALINRDSGIAVNNLITASSTGFAAEYSHQATVAADLELLRSLPGVNAVAPTRSIPLSGSGSATGFTSSTHDDAQDVVANYYLSDENLLEALGVRLKAGRNFRTEEVARLDDLTGYVATTALVTDAFAKKLFPDEENVIGKLMYDSPNKPVEIVGVIEKMHGAWVNWGNLDHVVIFPIVVDGPHVRYLINVDENRVQELVPIIEERLAASNTDRLINRVRPFKEVVAQTYSRDRGMAVALTVVIVMLIIVTALGIVGLAAFNVRQRTKQIGTRRAVGARRGHILRYFLAENWLMTTAGVMVGVALTMLLNYHLATEYSLDKLDPVYVPIGILAMWALGLLAVLGPAWRASLISPAIATRTV